MSLSVLLVGLPKNQKVKLGHLILLSSVTYLAPLEMLSFRYLFIEAFFFRGGTCGHLVPRWFNFCTRDGPTHSRFWFSGKPLGKSFAQGCAGKIIIIIIIIITARESPPNAAI